MKILYSFILVLLFSGSIIAQNINQLDANGARHGKWEKKFENTNFIRYQGQFNHGKEVGLFKFYKLYKNKTNLSATKLFNDNNNVAEVKFYGPYGNVISEGRMKGKIYVGTWKYYQKNTNVLLTLEHYNDNGKLNGERIVYYPNGTIIAEKQNYRNGKLQGQALSFSENSQVVKIYNYENDLLQGKAQFFNSKGDLLAEGQYKNDKKDGVWKKYENSKIKEEIDYSYKPKYKKKK